MPLVSTRLLVINRHLDFSVTIKRALQQLGGYEVSAFTSADAALDYLRSHQQDVVLVDFSLREISGETLIAQIRDIQPQIAIIASPKNSDTQRAVTELDLQGVVHIPITARELLPILERAVNYTLDTETAEVSVSPTFATLSEVVNNFGVINATETLEVDMSDIDPQRKNSLFNQLAAEEPPMPGLEENGTVSQLRFTMMDTGVREVVEILKENDEVAEPQPLPPDDGEDPEAPALARQILETALSEELPAFSEAVEMEPEEVLALQTDLPPQPVTETNVAQLALDLTQASLELTAEATLLTQDREIIAQAGEMAVEDIEDIRQVIGGDWDTTDTQSRIRFVTLPASGKDYMLFSRRTEYGYTLTMIFAGNMPLRVIRRQSQRLLQALHDIPDEHVDAVTHTPLETLEIPLSELPDFAGTLEAPLEEHVEAVERVEEVAPAKPPVQIVPVKPEVLTPYTFIWILRDSEQPLSDGVAQAVVAGLDLTLSQRLWSIHTLQVHNTYIYLYADVPGEQSAHDVVPELKRLSAEITQNKDQSVDIENMWADAYLVLTPGRELDLDEVERFIRFVRFP